MASTAPPHALEAHTLASLQHDRRNTALGLLWGGVLMVLLALWLPAKHADLTALVPGIVWILAVSAFLMALYSFAPRLHGTPDEQRQQLLALRRPVGGQLAVGGVVLIALAVLLASWYRLEAFGECFGMALLGLVALAWGLSHLRPVDRSLGHDRILQFLLERRPLVSIVLFALAGVLIVVAGVWGIRVYRWSGFPEWGAALLIAFIALGGGIWLRSTADRPVPLAALRLFVLITGGLTGLVLAVMAFCRGFALGGEFFRGTAGWTGPEAWKLWLVIYVAMIGLALMFASLSLAQVEIRVNPLLRRLLYGYNTVLNGLLLLTILVVLNVLVYAAYPYTANWTRSGGLHDLSPNSKRLLENLREPTKIYAIMAPNAPEYADVRVLLDNAQAFSDRLQVVFLSPDRDPREYKRLLEAYPELARDAKMDRGQFDSVGGRGVLIVYGPETTQKDRKVPHSFLNATSLREVKRDFQGARRGGGRPTVVFKGEPAIMTELQFLMMNKQKPKVYFLQGRRGEYFDLKDLTPGVNSFEGGLGMFVDRLKKDNYEVRGLSFLPAPPRVGPDDPVQYVAPGPDGKVEVPADAKVLVLAGPKLPPEQPVLDALDRYMERTGKLIVLMSYEGPVDPVTRTLKTTSLETWLKKYSVDATTDFLVRLPQNQRDDPWRVPVEPAPGGNPIARNFRGSKKVFHMELVRVVRPQPAPGGAFTAETILQVPFDEGPVVATSNLLEVQRADQFLGGLIRRNELANRALTEPPSVAVAVTDKDQKPRLIVMGTSLFITNYNMQSNATGAYDLQVSFLEWLAERPGGMDIRPKETGTYTIDPDISRAQIVFLPAWLMVVGIIGLGTGIWIVRRR
jgi:hypothetical protein